jgi:hypothetical protein
MHRSKLRLYSITWSARTRKAGGKVNPIAFARFGIENGKPRHIAPCAARAQRAATL